MSRRQSKPKSEKVFSLYAPGRPVRAMKENQLHSHLNLLVQNEAWKEILQICSQLGVERFSHGWITNTYFKALEATDQKQALIQECQAAIQASPRDPALLSWLAHAMRLNGRVDESVEILRRAIKKAKPDAALFNSLGSALKETGEFEEADSWFSRAIAMQPNLAKAHWNQSDLVTDHQAAIDAIEAQIKIKHDSKNIELPDDHLLNFSLYRHYEKLEDFESAFSNLRKGNEKKRTQINYDAEQNNLLTDRVIEFFDKSRIEPIESEDHANQPIFIFGLPRSGTTLVEQILASHSEVYGGNELTFLNDAAARVQNQYRLTGNFPEWTSALDDSGWQKIGSSYLQLLDTLSVGNKRVTDKSLMNYKAAGLIARALPNAKMVHVVRDPMDVAFGCYRQVFGSGHLFSYQFDEIADMLMDHKKLLNHWRQILPTNRYHVLNYQQLVQDPSGQIAKLLSFCELRDEATCYRPEQTERTVRTLSATQVRQPINSSGLGAWKRYEIQLQPLLNALKIRDLN